MKKRLPDLLFILGAAALMLSIVEFDLQEILVKYAFLFLLASYFIGRMVGRERKEE